MTELAAELADLRGGQSGDDILPALGHAGPGDTEAEGAGHGDQLPLRAPLRATTPHDYCGIARTTLEAAAREHREWAAAACATQGDDGEMRRDSRLDDERFPRIALVAESVTQVPAPDDW